ncbi:DUF4430 domain-containing protein [Halobacillus fulvus]|nr:DUF4430 domain-containing protein [Halobacillus fulvus]
MNKMYALLVAFLMAVGILAGCGTTQSTDSQEVEEAPAAEEQSQEVSVTVEVNDEGENLATEEITVEQGTTLMEIMKDNFDVEETEGFINAIEGIQGSEEEKMAWMFNINGEPAMVGANEYEVEQGDEITFNYESWE